MLNASYVGNLELQEHYEGAKAFDALKSGWKGHPGIESSVLIQLFEELLDVSLFKLLLTIYGHIKAI